MIHNQIFYWRFKQLGMLQQ